MAMGADDYLAKPFRAGELISSIQAQLSKRENLLKNAEARLEEVQKSLSMSLPHELRTPLTVIFGYSDILISQASVLDRDVITNMARQIHSAAQRRHRVAENIKVLSDVELLASNKESARTARQIETPNVGELIQRIAFEKALAADRSLDLTTELNEGSVHMSSTYLKKVFDELIDNAFKFSPAGSPVRVTSGIREAEYVVTIEDEGTGMSDGQLKALQPFVQYDREYYEQSGIGIGLTIVRRIVEIHGGSLSIGKTKTPGAIFEVRIPALT